jgi:hypothetical protein
VHVELQSHQHQWRACEPYKFGRSHQNPLCQRNFPSFCWCCMYKTKYKGLKQLHSVSNDQGWFSTRICQRSDTNALFGYLKIATSLLQGHSQIVSLSVAPSLVSSVEASFFQLSKEFTKAMSTGKTPSVWSLKEANKDLRPNFMKTRLISVLLFSSTLTRGYKGSPCTKSFGALCHCRDCSSLIWQTRLSCAELKIQAWDLVSEQAKDP